MAAKKWNSKIIIVDIYNLGLIKHVIYVDIDISNMLAMLQAMLAVLTKYLRTTINKNKANLCKDSTVFCQH